MREELYGVEDSFKFTSHSMSVYAHAVIDERDSSVETYLLNYWVKEFNLRDLIDRITAASMLDERYFSTLFSWLMNSRLSGNSEETWVIEDFRKVALLLSKNLQ
jgi:hypothetical protein